MPDATDTAEPRFETPASKIRNEHWERLEAMVGDNAGQTWDFSPNDIAAIEWALAEINRLLAANAMLRWERAK